MERVPFRLPSGIPIFRRLKEAYDTVTSVNTCKILRSVHSGVVGSLLQWRGKICSLETAPVELECSKKRVIGSGRCSCEVKEGKYKKAFEYALEDVIGDLKKL